MQINDQTNTLCNQNLVGLPYLVGKQLPTPCPDIYHFACQHLSFSERSFDCLFALAKDLPLWEAPHPSKPVVTVCLYRYQISRTRLPLFQSENGSQAITQIVRQACKTLTAIPYQRSPPMQAG
jgi:hypothetical protein